MENTVSKEERQRRADINMIHAGTWLTGPAATRLHHLRTRALAKGTTVDAFSESVVKLICETRASKS